MSFKAGIWDWTDSGALTEAWEALLGDHVPLPTSFSFLTESSSNFTGNKREGSPNPSSPAELTTLGCLGLEENCGF